MDCCYDVNIVSCLVPGPSFISISASAHMTSFVYKGLDQNLKIENAQFGSVPFCPIVKVEPFSSRKQSLVLQN